MTDLPTTRHVDYRWSYETSLPPQNVARRTGFAPPGKVGRRCSRRCFWSAGLRLWPRHTADGARPRSVAIARMDQPAFSPAEISHRSPAVNIRRTPPPRPFASPRPLTRAVATTLRHRRGPVRARVAGPRRGKRWCVVDRATCRRYGAATDRAGRVVGVGEGAPHRGVEASWRRAGPTSAKKAEASTKAILLTSSSTTCPLAAEPSAASTDPLIRS